MQKILDDFPFLTLGNYSNQEYLGIVGNSDQQLLSMYVYGLLPNDDMKKLFLSLGEEWWWETNRQIPISISLRDKWQVFRPYLRSFSMKDFEVVSGPCLSLDDLNDKRVKRRHIQLVRRMD